MSHTLKTARHHQSATQLSDRQQRIYGFLSTHPVGVLSSVSPDGDPHGAVVHFVIDKQFTVSFLTKDDTRKYDNLKHFNHIMLTVFDASAQTTAQITGTATEIQDRSAVPHLVWAILEASLDSSVGTGLPPIAKLQAGSYAAFSIQPAQIRMAVYSRPDPGDYTELYETLESFDLKDL